MSNGPGPPDPGMVGQRGGTSPHCQPNIIGPTRSRVSWKEPGIARDPTCLDSCRTKTGSIIY